VLTHSGHIRWHALYDPNHSLPIRSYEFTELDRKNGGFRAGAIAKESGQCYNSIKLALQASVEVNRKLMQGNSRASGNTNGTGKVWINNGTSEVRVYPPEVSQFIGFSKGMLKKKQNGN
jgi:hypothetical protein